jgi:ubiquinone biosynthesis accessory factor UbiJ
VLNHVLMGEQEAMRRLARQSGRYVTFVWRTQEFVLGITPVGLFERGSSGSSSDLRLVVQSADVLVLAADWVNGRKPEVHIDGDVQLAADVNWLADLAKVMGDVPAHMLVTLAHSVSGVLKRFVSATPSTGGASA